jgi:hypothetical protein
MCWVGHQLSGPGPSFTWVAVETFSFTVSFKIFEKLNIVGEDLLDFSSSVINNLN